MSHHSYKTDCVSKYRVTVLWYSVVAPLFGCLTVVLAELLKTAVKIISVHYKVGMLDSRRESIS